MRLGLVFAIVLHAAVILFAAFYVINVTPLAMPVSDIPVDVVTLAPTTNVKAAAPKEEKPAEKPAPEVAPAPEKAEPPPKEAVAIPEEKPEPKKPDPKPQEKPKPPPEDKPKDEHLNLDDIQKVLKNKANQDKKAAQKTADASAPGADDKPRAKVGDGEQNTADIDTLIANALNRQMQACWTFPAGAADAVSLKVSINIRLRPDGNLVEPPTLVDQSRMGETYYRAAAEAALRAINKCQPYDLPKDHYDRWKDLILNFDPSQMVGQ